MLRLSSSSGNKFFRRDQIWFTEKDKYGTTDLYSLAEYKIPDDAPFEKDYIAGRYGAIPFIGGLHYLDFLVGGDVLYDCSPPGSSVE